MKKIFSLFLVLVCAALLVACDCDSDSTRDAVESIYDNNYVEKEILEEDIIYEDIIVEDIITEDIIVEDILVEDTIVEEAGVCSVTDVSKEEFTVREAINSENYSNLDLFIYNKIEDSYKLAMHTCKGIQEEDAVIISFDDEAEVKEYVYNNTIYNSEGRHISNEVIEKLRDKSIEKKNFLYNANEYKDENGNRASVASFANNNGFVYSDVSLTEVSTGTYTLQYTMYYVWAISCVKGNSSDPFIIYFINEGKTYNDTYINFWESCIWYGEGSKK